ncbi:MAG: SPOR domain-containing protein [Pseudomonas sp.]|nr:SPOR domain-containing protein [Pseudomonas sp.]
MAAAESKLKQRIVGALVLIALAVIFLPMLFKQEDSVREVVVQAPPMPIAPETPQYPVADVAVPEPVVDDEWDQPIITEPSTSIANASTEPVTPVAPVAPLQPAKPVADQQANQPVTKQPAQQAVAPGIDKNNLPVTWSVQLANLTNKANAEALRDAFRKKQYNAYVRSTDGTHRVLIGPLVKQADAQSMCKSLKARENQECFVVRYQP